MVPNNNRIYGQYFNNLDVNDTLALTDLPYVPRVQPAFDTTIHNNRINYTFKPHHVLDETKKTIGFLDHQGHIVPQTLITPILTSCMIAITANRNNIKI